MKKLINITLIVLCLIIPLPVKAESVVTIYLFRGATCSHCEESLEYFQEHIDEIPENVKFVTFEVWENQNNNKLHLAVAEKLGLNESEYNTVPLFVVGEEYILGYGSGTFEELITIAEKYLDDGDYQDIVKETKDELNINVKSQTLKELFPEPNKIAVIITYSIFGTIVIGLVCLIIFSRK